MLRFLVGLTAIALWAAIGPAAYWPASLGSGHSEPGVDLVARVADAIGMAPAAAALIPAQAR